jgi:hypothetical protein
MGDNYCQPLLFSPAHSIPSHFYHPPSCSGINSPRLFTPTFGAHRVPSSKTTLTMTPRRMSQHFHQDKGPPRESTNNNPPLHQPSTQNLPTIAEDPEHPTFGDMPEVQLHQPTHTSTTATGPSQNSGAASSTQTGRGARHQSPTRAPSPLHMVQGDAELDQVQIHDWGEETEEDKVAAEEELARVQ